MQPTYESIEAQLLDLQQALTAYARVFGHDSVTRKYAELYLYFQRLLKEQ